MENQIEIKVELKNPEITIEDDLIKIGDLYLSAYHDQDCCERVYADFEVFTSYLAQIKNMSIIENVRIKGVSGEGFVVFFEGTMDWTKEYYEQKVGVFVPCYNEQNGYYSSNLILNIVYDAEEYVFDLNDCIDDRIQ